MELEKGLVTFFKITDCGFYKHSKGTSEYVDGGLADTLKAVTQWLDGRPVQNTIPWDTEKSPMRTEIYCKSVYHDEKTGDYLFVLWRKFGNDSGSVNGILPLSTVGDSGKDSHRVETQYGDQNLILGEPMYYWFITEKNLVASIKFKGAVSDSSNVFSYIKRCMDYRIKHPRKKEIESTVFNRFANKEVFVKRISYGTEDGKNTLVFKFNAELLELSINNAGLNELAKKITHLVVRDTISSSKEVVKHPAFKLYDKFLGKANESIAREKQIEIVTEQTLTVDELADIIKTYNEDFDSLSLWNNVGFKSEGIDSQTKWFNSYVERKHISINSDRKKGSYYPAESLFAVISDSRGLLLDFSLVDKGLQEVKSVIN